VLWALQRAGFVLRGFDLALLGDIPIGAGLSSSAALELAVARAAFDLSELEWDATRMAFIGQEAERDFIGVPCGIMDQFAAALSRKGCALLLDCRSLEAQPVPIPREAAVVVMDTGVRRKLAESAYRERVDQCAAAVQAVRDIQPDVRALRDVTPELLGELRSRMDPLLFLRTEHVVYENLRPIAMAGALRAGDPAGAGRLMRESHRSLRELFEVSSIELDTIVALADEHPACYGARLTGAGFAGCAVALVRRTDLGDFLLRVHAGFRARFAHPAVLYPCEPSAGAHVLSDPSVPATSAP
jgi:galactokinase